MWRSQRYPTKLILMVQTNNQIKVITKLPNSEQSYKGKVKTNNYINRQNQPTTGKLYHCNYANSILAGDSALAI
jgi:branched-subunit amino acid aminotransferase/4-amino-4-deoxychorismate lyase